MILYESRFDTITGGFYINLNFSEAVVLEKILKVFFPNEIHEKIKFPIVTPSELRGPWAEQIWICDISGSFYINLNFSDLRVLEKMILINGSILFLHFCDYKPFEEDLTLYFNNCDFTQEWFVPSSIGLLDLEETFHHKFWCIFTVLMKLFLLGFGRVFFSFGQFFIPSLRMICVSFG
jgi:hypothetical protein